MWKPTKKNIQFNVLQVPTSDILFLLLVLVSFFTNVLHLLAVKRKGQNTKLNVSISKFIADMHVEI